MRFFLFVFASLFSSAVFAQSGSVLPLAQGQYSVAFAQSKNAAPLAQGATVKFLVSKENAAPRELRFDGFVLGSHDSIVFVELTQEEAAYLAYLRVSQTIKLKVVAAPDPLMIADRQQAAAAEQAVTIAPRSRQITVPVAVSASTVESWTLGDRLVFPGAGAEVFWDWKLKKRQTRPADASGLFVSAEPLDDSKFEVTLVVDPESAMPLLQAAMQGRLSVLEEVANPVATVERHRCYIRHRRGNEVIRIEIPCVD